MKEAISGSTHTLKTSLRKKARKTLLAKTCNSCGTGGAGLTIDHIIPLSSGATHEAIKKLGEPWNIQTLCIACHIKKDALPKGTVSKNPPSIKKIQSQKSIRKKGAKRCEHSIYASENTLIYRIMAHGTARIYSVHCHRCKRHVGVLTEGEMSTALANCTIKVSEAKL